MKKVSVMAVMKETLILMDQDSVQKTVHWKEPCLDRWKDSCLVLTMVKQMLTATNWAGSLGWSMKKVSVMALMKETLILMAQDSVE